MLAAHHPETSRSRRILCVPELKAIHPLRKSPVPM